MDRAPFVFLIALAADDAPLFLLKTISRVQERGRTGVKFTLVNGEDEAKHYEDWRRAVADIETLETHTGSRFELRVMSRRAGK